MLNKKKKASPGMISMGRNNYAKNPKNTIVITPNLICNNIYDILSELGFPGIVDIGCNKGALSAPWKGEIPIIGIDILKCDFHTPGGFLKGDFLEFIEMKGKEGWLILCNPPFNRDKSITEMTQNQFDKLPTWYRKMGINYPHCIDNEDDITQIVSDVENDMKNEKKSIFDAFFECKPFKEQITDTIWVQHQWDDEIIKVITTVIKIFPPKYPKLPPERFLRKIVELFGPKFKGVLFTPMGLRLNQDWKSPRWRWMRDFGGRITSILTVPKDIFPGVKFHTEILFWNIEGLHPHYFLEG